MFKPVDPKQDFSEMERNILAYWEKEGILQKYLDRNSASKKKFSFVDGPITANNPMGLHHAWGRMYKDLFQRYKNMQGYEQRFQNGFDCQGLWVEVEVEKDLNFNSKKDIEAYGMDKFTNACKDRVKKFAAKQTEQSKRLGMFMDWENSYYTMSETNNLYIWRFLKECNEKGLIYKSKSATTWCPRCETGLSQHEQADGYMDVDDISVYVKFPLKGKKDEYFLVWTTTPWTLAANVLLAINTDHPYVKASVEGETWYLAEESAKRLKLTDTEDIKAESLLDLEFETLYPDIPAQKDVKHYVVNWDLVDPSEGTGIVHIAPGCGGEDFDLGKEVGAAIHLSPLDETGHFVDGYGFLDGKYAHDVADEVIAYLTKTGALYKTEEVHHSYPHCWRCKTKCLFRLEDNWFINISKIREPLKRAAEKANWIPEFVGKRMQSWLTTMGDWMISRKRVYGLSLPFYECSECGELLIIGSKEELKERAIKPELVDKLPSLHRPWIDEVEVKCPKCGKAVKRILDVGDCWLDAGVVPFSTLKYFEDKEYWKKWYPAEFVIEMVEQVRLWYYSMLVYGVIFEGSVPYKNVLNYGEVRDENGERFSKSKVNYVPFDDAAEKAGSDVIRWMYALQSVGTNIRFGWKTTEEVRRCFYLVLWNTYGYFVSYAQQHGFSAHDVDLKKGLHDMDRWVLSELNHLVTLAHEKLDAYDASSFVRAAQAFVQDVSTWYIRRSRSRFAQGDTAALSTLYTVLMTLSKLFAPIVPFVSEEIYQNLKDTDDVESVHLCEFPLVKEKFMDEEIRIQMETVRAVCALGQAARVTSGMRVRQPLSEVRVRGTSLHKDMLAIVADELNVKTATVTKNLPSDKNWNVQESKTVAVALHVALDDSLRHEGLLRDIMRSIQRARKENGLKVGELVNVTVVTRSNQVKTVIESNKDNLRSAVSASFIKVSETDPKSDEKERGISVTIEE